MVPLFRAVVVWTIVLATVILPHIGPSPAASTAAVTQLTSYDRTSALTQSKAKRTQAAQNALVQQWTSELSQGIAQYQAEQERIAKAQAEAQAEAARYAALNNHPPPPDWIGKIIYDAFSPLGARAVQWAINVAYCESRYHPNSVNTDSGASGLFQFMPSTWSGTPWAGQSPFDPVANAQAAAWLYSHYGPGRWTCQG